VGGALGRATPLIARKLVLTAASVYDAVEPETRSQNMTDQTEDNAPTVRQRVEQIVELIRPVIQSDGGDIELTDVTDEGVVKIRFLGACVGCPSATMTLQYGIERNLMERVPEVTAVVPVD
jgi:Fe-S cluster biogenesis protein NfuA